MLADTGREVGGGGGQFNNRLKPYSVIFSSSEGNKPQKDAEAHNHFQNLFLFFFVVYIK